MPKLEEIYLEANIIAGILGYETMPKLRRLHLRKNKIEKFEDGGETGLPVHEGLVYLNLRGNKVPSLDQVERMYTTFPNMTDINIIGNPVEK